ncbi:MAG: winged helix-turn-helix domain-containing tetratricopeptide repeat protein [Brevundimonas sp.]|uniref:winged helix-turn-helix domain-containing tetratricopeptide repeat protein n=1 Tax=Brevundimonas sp. TaxID=1871086 RepID=UPI00391A280D
MFRFAGFELDERRAELRGPDGAPVRLRPKPFSLLLLLVRNPGRVVSKQEVIDALWPNVHVGEDGLFQCVREVRIALGDDRRELLRLVPGRGYILTVAVTDDETVPPEPDPVAPMAATGNPRAVDRRGWRWPGIAAAVIGLCLIVGLAVWASAFGDLVFGRGPPSIAVIPMTDASGDPDGPDMARSISDRLVDGFARIDSIRVVTAPSTAAASSTADTDFVVRGELRRAAGSWTLQARLIRTSTGQVVAVADAAVDAGARDPELQQSRLTAGVGHLLARRLNDLLEGDGATAASAASARNTRVVIDQASASINQTSRERFEIAEAMLQEALVRDPDNIDLGVALAGLQLRGIQMAWYTPEEAAAARDQAGATLERALRVKPDSIPVAETYCRFLSATNQFVDSLVACSRTLSLDPWNGLALYHVGLGQIYLGRFEDALATFQQADRYGTPEVSRWTWLLGAGMAHLLLGNAEDALPWLHRSIAITSGSGRSHMLLAAAYQRTGRTAEARAAMQEGLRLRPGSSALNVPAPTTNASPAFVEASESVLESMVEAGLPAR